MQHLMTWLMFFLNFIFLFFFNVPLPHFLIPINLLGLISAFLIILGFCWML